MSVRHASPVLFLLTLLACGGDTDTNDSGIENPCAEAGALASCLSPTQTDEYYIEQSSRYFDTMDYTVELESWPPYSELVARWEWPPWLKLTAYTRANIEATDTLLLLYPSIVPERECKAFDTQPFGRCYVVFYYDEHEGKGCPIYEEFSFNDQGEITFIEAWSDVDGLRPQETSDRWAEGPSIARLSARVPGLGTSTGKIDLDSEAMTAAAEADLDVADFVYRAKNWYTTWLEEYENAGDDLWERGCGWAEAT
jgi:hypothetical protein